MTQWSQHIWFILSSGISTSMFNHELRLDGIVRLQHDRLGLYSVHQCGDGVDADPKVFELSRMIS